MIRYGRNDYGAKSHSSLHISNGLWTWWAHNIGGKSALDYLIKVENFDFIEAASLIQKCIEMNPPIISKQNNKFLIAPLTHESFHYWFTFKKYLQR